MVYRIIFFLLITYNCIGQEIKISKVKVEQLPFSEKEYFASKWFYRPNESSRAVIIDSVGNYFTQDADEGISFGYSFYSKEGKLINQYRPFNFFHDFVNAFDEKYFVIAAFRNHISDTIKLAILNHKGILISERLIVNSKKNLSLQTIKIVNNTVILVINDSNSVFTIKTFDNKLIDLWTKQLSDFVFYDGVSIDKMKNSLFISAKRELLCLDLFSGKTNWSIKPFEKNDTLRVYQTSLLFNNKLIGLYKFGAIEDKKHNITLVNSNLELRNSKNGELIYEERLDNTNSFKDTYSDISFYNNLFPNIDVSEFYFMRVGLIWRYRLEDKNEP